MGGIFKHLYRVRVEGLDIYVYIYRDYMIGFTGFTGLIVFIYRYIGLWDL